MNHPLHRRPTRAPKLVAPALVAVLLAGLVATPARAAAVAPELELVAPSDTVTLWRYGRNRPVSLELGLLVAARSAPFELWAQRPDYAQPPTLTQVLRGPDGEVELRAMDPDLMDGWEGLKDFFVVTFRDAAGTVVAMKTMGFCPSGYDRQRIDDSGPSVPAYPGGCFANPFTKGVVWGIDQGWAASTTGFRVTRIDIPNGTYHVTAGVSQRYVDAFGVAPEDATVEITATVKRAREGSCGPKCYHRVAQADSSSSAGEVPTNQNPDPTILPDLVALPSWGIRVQNRRDRARLSFGATVWAAGASSLVVEGFRREGAAVMDAFQYFYDGEEVVGKAPAGELEFDERDGHHHWHFKQFAGYSLLNADGIQVRKSRKEAFCLAPTDAIDLTLPNADWNPGSIGLTTACGNPSSIWIREILPLGWGDTYFQGLPGQSFNVTDLPNGTYYIKVEANPGSLLHEQRSDNNVQLRLVYLRGKPDRRRVVVPPWNGIDTEGGLGRG